MDKRKIQKITQAYLETIANADEFNFVDEGHKFKLSQVYVMLEAFKTVQPRSKERRDELPPTAERLQSAGVDSPDKNAEEISQSPVSLSKVLNESKHLVLLGEPGAGKTTTLNFIALYFANHSHGWVEEYLQVHEEWVPIKLQLQVYRNQLANHDLQLFPALVNEVCSRLQPFKQEDAEETIKMWLETGNLLILLDGLDEVQEQRSDVMNNIRQFAESPTGKLTRIVMTSRLAGYVTQGSTFKEYTIKPLQTEMEAKIFLNGWLTSLNQEWEAESETKSEELFKQLQGQQALRRLLNNPLILRMAAEQYARDEKIARNRAHLYKDYIEKEVWKRALGRGALEASKTDALAALEALAWQSQMGKNLTENEAVSILQDKKFSLVSEEAKAEELLGLLRQKMGILVLVDQNYVFSHTTFREYFVARRLYRAWKKGRNGQKLTWEFLSPRLHLSAWRESLLLFSSLLYEDEATISFIDMVYSAKSQYESQLGRDLLLSALILGESGISISKSIKRYIKLLGNRELSFQATKALGIIGPQAIPALLQLVKDEDKNVRRSAAEALGRIGDAEAIPALLQLVKDEDKNVRRSAAEALGRIGDAEAIPALLQLLKDAEYSVRTSATEALGLIGDAQAIPALFQLVKPRGIFQSVNTHAAKALSHIGPQAIPALVELVKDEDYLVRLLAANTLGQIGPQAFHALLQLVKDEDKAVRSSVAEALGWTGDAGAIPALLQLVKDEDKPVRRSAVWALGQIGDAQAIPALLRLVKDEDKDLRSSAVRALGQIGDAQAIPALLQLVKDEDKDLRSSAVRALGQIGDAQAIPALLQLVKDEDKAVRSSAVVALGRIGDAEAIPALLQLVKDEDRDVRQSATGALGWIGDAQAIPALLQLVKDEDRNVRRSAAWALSQIGGAGAVSALLEAVKDKDRYVRDDAAEGLGRIGDAGAVSALLEAVKDEDSDVRHSAAKALVLIVQRTRTATGVNQYSTPGETVQKVAKSLARAGELNALLDILDILETLTAPQFDPLNPPPRAKWVEVSMNIGKYVVAAILLTLVGLAAFAISTAQGTLKPILEKWFQAQPVTVILVLLVCLTLLAIVGKQLVDKYFSKQK